MSLFSAISHPREKPNTQSPKRMKWLMDTGCSHDLIGLKADKLGLSPRMSSEAMTFMTANGITETDQKVDLVIDETKDTISPFVVEECADSGYGFLWMPGEEPVMFDDRMSVIRLRVKDHTPYLVTQ